eukprot:Awhi_evm1s10336
MTDPKRKSSESLSENIIELNNVIISSKPIPKKKYTLDDTLEDKQLLDELRLFTKLDHTEENLDFIESVNHFKKKKDPALCSKIVENFIAVNSKQQINVSHRITEEIYSKLGKYKKEEEEFKNGTITKSSLDYTIFDDAFRAVRQNIAENTLVRFNSTKLENVNSARSRLHMNPSRFRRVMICMMFLNLFFFLILACFVLVSNTFIASDYKQDVRIISLGGDIQLYDSILTSNAKLTATTAAIGSDYTRYETIYNATSILMGGVTTQLAMEFPSLSFSATVDAANDALFALESEVFRLVHAGNYTEALGIFSSNAYTSNKVILLQAINDLQVAIDHQVNSNLKLQQSLFFATVAIIVTFCCYSIPMTIFMIKMERVHTKTMLKLTKELNENLQLTRSSSNGSTGTFYQ